MIDDCSVCKSICNFSGITAGFTHTTDGAAIWGCDHILTQSACSPRWYWPGSKRARECQLRSNKPLACLISGYNFPNFGESHVFIFQPGFLFYSINWVSSRCKLFYEPQSLIYIHDNTIELHCTGNDVEGRREEHRHHAGAWWAVGEKPTPSKDLAGWWWG